MTEDEIQRLGVMLDAKLSGVESRVDEKLSGLERRFDTMDQHLTTVDQRVDELHRHFDVVAEGLEGQVRQVAEGVVLVGERLERAAGEQQAARVESSRGFAEIQAMIKLSYVEIDRRLTTLEGVVTSLARRVQVLEQRPSQ